MHVIFVSMCEKRAIKRTRAVLDGYANRIGNNTWATSITEEALNAVRGALKKTATRQSSIACFRNFGLRQMRLMWVVGSRSTFGRHGEIAIGTQLHASQSVAYYWLNDACRIAKYSGLGHDIGKSGFFFQDKLSRAVNADGGSSSDNVRHELISAVVMHRMLNQSQSWGDVWNDMDIGRHHSALDFINNGRISTPIQSILFCIATHHRLFGGNDGCLDLINHIASDVLYSVKNNHTRSSVDIQRISEKLSANITGSQNQFNYASDELYFYGISLIARAGLILADHKISAIKVFHEDENQCFANTAKRDKRAGLEFNQSLKWHLAQVGRESGMMVRNMAMLDAPSICPSSMDNLLQQSDGRFEWQNRAAQSLIPNVPTLLFNIAATGAGKTRMNARAAAVLAGDKPLRLSVVLNLRSLTLQTGDTYKNELGVMLDEIAVVIGKDAIRRMHEYEASDIEENDLTQSEESEDDLITKDEPYILPEWLEGLELSPVNKAVLMSPILISTIDNIINAGDPRKQKKHAMALMRVMHSDLIIDEVDNYNPKALSAVIRVVKLSAMFGRNVIASSATLSTAEANMIHKSYESGFAIFKKMNNYDGGFNVGLIDNMIKPEIGVFNEFPAIYSGFINSMMVAISKNNITKKGEIVKFTPTSKSLMMDAIRYSVEIMHARHQWGDSQRLSIGLIRIANIGNAIEVARYLEKLEDTYVCCYHAKHFAIQRFHIERRLDFLLKRKGEQPNTHIVSDPEIQSLFVKSNGRPIKIIVVATPVEEVGRDHDFDWSIIEPSSAQSIVQTAGRVNRHRLMLRVNLSYEQLLVNSVI